VQRDDHYARSVGARRHAPQLSAHVTVIHIVGDLFAYLGQFAELLFGYRIVGLRSEFPVLGGLLSQVIRVLVDVTTSKVSPSQVTQYTYKSTQVRHGGRTLVVT
jgi:hypothetical protein